MKIVMDMEGDMETWMRTWKQGQGQGKMDEDIETWTRTWKHERGHGNMNEDIETDIKTQTRTKKSNGKRKPRRFLFVYHLLIMQTEVCRSSVCWWRTNGSYPFATQLNVLQELALLWVLYNRVSSLRQFWKDPVWPASSCNHQFPSQEVPEPPDTFTYPHCQPLHVIALCILIAFRRKLVKILGNDVSINF
jgi:hypothetical protein